MLLILSSLFSTYWTVMVYMGGDNTLSSVIDQNFNDMVKGTEEVNLVVFVDRDQGEDCIYHVKDKTFNIIKKYDGDVDSGDPEVLIDFVKLAKNNYPAKKYALILWNHGDGWYSYDAIIFDNTSRNSIGVSDGELAYALEEIKNILHKKISILIMDACDMGQIEVAGEVYKYADLMIASQLDVPADGLPYYDVMNNFSQLHDPNIIAKNIVDSYVNLYEHKYPGYNMGFSIYDFDKYEEFIEQLKDFISSHSAENLYEEVKPFYSSNVDFGQYVDPSILQPFIYYKNYTEESLSGVDVWIPQTYNLFKYYWKEYANLRFNSLTNWLGFLSNHFNSDILPPVPVFSFTFNKNSSYVTVFCDSIYFFSPISIYALILNSFYKKTSHKWDGTGFQYKDGMWFSSGGGLIHSDTISTEGLPAVISFDLMVDTRMSLVDDNLKNIVVVNVYGGNSLIQSDTFYGNSGEMKYRRFFEEDNLVVELSYICEDTETGKGVKVSDVKCDTYMRKFYKNIDTQNKIMLPAGKSDIFIYSRVNSDRISFLSDPFSAENKSSYSLPVFVYSDRIEIPVDYYEADYKIYSLDGRLIYKGEPDYNENRFIVNIPFLTRGIYFLKIGDKIGKFLWIKKSY